MGADIHIYIEYKVGDSPWQADKNHIIEEEDSYKSVKSVDASSRDYNLFAALASVRGPGPEPKGLPTDISERVLLASNLYGRDGHSHSFSSLKEFESIYKKTVSSYEPGHYDKEAKPKAFYDGGFSSEEYRSTNYSTLIAYCKNQVNLFKLDLESEQMLLGQKINTNVLCRLVFWFDN